ncbi:GNAT family N-acetyltransferase [Sphingobacterium lactis]|uniref:GNAT family N-acetyltransferase n=1 Tax=Sphingobacterium lactis TaxID=797291 RepID=UPI003F7FD15B
MKLVVNEHIVLERTSSKYAPELFQIIERNRNYLSEFLPWVPGMKLDSDFYGYISNAVIKNEEKYEASFTILYNEEAVGRIGLHHINWNNKNAAIGYWIDQDKNGKGIVINACKRLIKYGFEELNLNRIEIKAAVNNTKSQAIPQKLNFKEEGILRQAELVNDEYLDIKVFSMLKEEFQDYNN